MKRSLGVLAVVLTAAGAGVLAAQDPTQKIDLKVLYVTGAPESRRTTDFTEFLGKTFTEVGSVELKSLDAKASAKYDVVIVDSPSPYLPAAETRAAGRTVRIPEAPVLPADYSKPTILMGAAGGAVLNKMQLKLQWL
jgi:hypothetical protein